MIRVGILGASGKMGLIVQKLLKNEFATNAFLHSTSDKENPQFELLSEADVIIDFSLPEAVNAFLDSPAVKKKQPPLVIGSTGWKDLKNLNQYAAHTPILMSSNFSIGVYATHLILKNSAPLLKKLGYRPSIIDIHHTHKRDAPSGTALALQNTLLESFVNESIPIDSIREGEVIGDHQNVFESTGDKIVIQHFAKDRSIFARGALETALWLAQEHHNHKNLKGFLTMDDFFQKKYGHLF